MKSILATKITTDKFILSDEVLQELADKAIGQRTIFGNTSFEIVETWIEDDKVWAESVEIKLK